MPTEILQLQRRYNLLQRGNRHVAGVVQEGLRDGEAYAGARAAQGRRRGEEQQHVVVYTGSVDGASAGPMWCAVRESLLLLCVCVASEHLLLVQYK